MRGKSCVRGQSGIRKCFSKNMGSVADLSSFVQQEGASTVIHGLLKDTPAGLVVAMYA
jgi:hypothetical protein